MRYIPAESIGAEWPRVRDGLIEVQKNSVEDWLPEDVYLSLKTNNAALYIVEREAYLGFAILQIIPTFHSKRMHVWCAYSATKKPMLMLMLDDLKELAAKSGCGKITFSSPRDEWLVTAKRGGFRSTQTTYELSL